MIKILIITILSFACVNLLSQDLDDIVTDRPDQTESALTIPKGFIQAELGASIEQVEVIQTPLGSLSIHDHCYPSLLVRYGISNNVELRLAIEYLQTKYNNIEYDIDTENGFSPISLGTKISLFGEKGARPETAFLFHIAIPFSGNRTFQSRYVGGDFRFSMSHELSERFALSYNLGGEWSGEDPRATGIYTLSLGVSLMNRLSMYAESYGFLTQDQTPDHRLDGGFTYLFSKNIQADISGGIGISDRSPDYFIGAGLSFRLPR